MSSCPTFGDGGPSGIAEALRVVDCMSGEAASFAFGRLFGSDALLGQALTAALTLYIALPLIGAFVLRQSPDDRELSRSARAAARMRRS